MGLFGLNPRKEKCEKSQRVCPLGQSAKTSCAMSDNTSSGAALRPPNRLFRFVLESHDGSDIDAAVVDGLKALDPERPIREATNAP